MHTTDFAVEAARENLSRIKVNKKRQSNFTMNKLNTRQKKNYDNNVVFIVCLKFN